MGEGFSTMELQGRGFVYTGASGKRVCTHKNYGFLIANPIFLISYTLIAKPCGRRSREVKEVGSEGSGK